MHTGGGAPAERSLVPLHLGGQFVIACMGFGEFCACYVNANVNSLLAISIWDNSGEPGPQGQGVCVHPMRGEPGPQGQGVCVHPMRARGSERSDCETVVVRGLVCGTSLFSRASLRNFIVDLWLLSSVCAGNHVLCLPWRCKASVTCMYARSHVYNQFTTLSVHPKPRIQG